MNANLIGGELMEYNFDLEFMERILEQIPSNIFFKDTECRYVFSTHYWRHLDIDTDDKNWTIKGKTDIDVRKDKDNAIKAYEQDKKVIETGIGVDYEIEIDQDGIKEYLHIIKNPVKDDNGNVIGIVGLINDVTKRVELEKQLEAYTSQLKIQSETDPLTNICNRRSGEQFIVNCINAKQNGVFFLMDVDKFKYVNDTFGHGVGDELLIAIANTLKSTFRTSDVVMRLGGDEFVAFATKVDSPELVKIIVNRLFDNMSKIDIKSMNGHKISISLGAYLCTGNESFDDMYQYADSVMYKSKKIDGFSYHLYGYEQ